MKRLIRVLAALAVIVTIGGVGKSFADDNREMLCQAALVVEDWAREDWLACIRGYTEESCKSQRDNYSQAVQNSIWWCQIMI